jgi:hypothetical protein
MHMTFNIGSQSGGVINNVGGDQHIAGGQQGTVITTEQARQALHDLRGALSSAPLDRGTADAARAEVTEMDAAMREASPDRSRFAAALNRLTRVLTAAGSLASAGTALAGPLHILATWVGAVV